MAKTTADESHPALQTIIARVEERVNAHNLSRNEASRRAGLGLGYVNDLLAGKTKMPSRQSLAKIGQVVDTDVAYFVGEQDAPRKTGPSAHAQVVVAEPVAKAIPLYRVGLPDADGFVPLEETKKSAAILPSGGDDGIYCIQTPDDTMAPRYLSGEIVIVSSNRRPSKGGFAVVRHVDGRVAIREVVAIAPDKITLRSLSPDEVVELKRDTVKSLDRVIGTCEPQ